MFSRILIPTDGSALAGKGIEAGVALAKRLGARVVGYHAMEPIERIYYLQGDGVRDADVQAIRRRLRELGEHYLAGLGSLAAGRQVACETMITDSAEPFRGIIDAAREQRCDLICMASHGRGEVASALLGNVTQKVLAHSKVPVLVVR